MSFYKTSRADILAYRSATEKGFTRNASQAKTSSFFQNNGTKVDVKAALENVADTYKISDNPGDYIFVISRALTADVPNENHDCFPADELLRFDPKLGCRVFQTFNLKPNHINHRADDPTQARGVILDAHYNDMNGEGFVEILVAVDKTKDKKLAEGILKGDINSMSMGCTSEECHCSICGHVATSSDELCPKHIRGGLKGKEFDGKKAYEKCYKVCFQEESWVDDPADPQALVSEVLGLQAQLKEAEKKHRMEDESTILILQNRIAKIEELLETMQKESLKVETKFKQKKVDDSAITNIEQESETEVKTDLDKFIEKSNTEELKPMSSAEFGVAVATKNPYVKIAEGKTPSLWKSPGGAEGKVPALWKSPGKGSGSAPALWKKAFMEKLALDNAAKEYWTKYFQDYGQELVKDIKKKKLAGKITIENMKTIEPKFAEMMTKANMESIQVDNILELEDAIKSIEVPVVVEAKKDIWASIDNKIKEKKADLEIALVGEEWVLREGSKNIFSVKNAFGISKEAFEGDDFGQSICKSLLEDGAEKTATEYKVSLYDATSNEPASIIDGAEDDMREKVREKPTKGIEESGSDDLADMYRGDIEEPKGTSEGGQRDIVSAKSAATSEQMLEVEKEIIDLVEKKHKLPKEDVSEILTVIKDKYMSTPDNKEERKEEKEEKIETEIEAPITDVMEPKEGKKGSVSEIIRALKGDMAAQGKSESDPSVQDAIKAILATYGAAGGETVEHTYGAPETVSSSVEDKAANLLDDPIRDIADAEKHQEEVKTNIVEDGTDDLVDVKRESELDTVYEDGQDDLDATRGEVVKISAKELEEKIAKSASEIAENKIAQEMDIFKKAYDARLKKALNISIRRANLNLIDNELKAAMYDVLTNEFDLPTDEVVQPLDNMSANCLIEAAFDKGAKKFFDNILKEADRAMNVSEDALLEIEADLSGLNVAPVTAAYTKKEVVVNHKAKEASAGNPVFKSTHEVNKPKFSGLKGIFRS